MYKRQDFSEVILDLWDAEIYVDPLFRASAIHHQEKNFPAWMIDAQTTVNELPPFVNPALADFRIEGTASQWTGIPSTPEFSPLEVSVGLLGEPRNTLAPTKGCYEGVP